MEERARKKCSMDAEVVMNEYFLEHRAKILEIAAFLDRLDRAQGDASDDFRHKSFYAALAVLTDGQGDRTARILNVLSDPTTEAIESAAGMKGAHGAWPAFAGREVKS